MPAFSVNRSRTRLIVAVVLEEGLVGPHDLRVLLETLPDAAAQADDPLDAISRQERVAEDLLGLLPDAVHAAGALDQPNDRPRQVVIDDDRAVLEVLPLAEHIGRNEDVQLISWRRPGRASRC